MAWFRINVFDGETKEVEADTLLEAVQSLGLTMLGMNKKWSAQTIDKPTTAPTTTTEPTPTPTTTSTTTEPTPTTETPPAGVGIGAGAGVVGLSPSGDSPINQYVLIFAGGKTQTIEASSYSDAVKMASGWGIGVVDIYPVPEGYYPEAVEEFLEYWAFTRTPEGQMYPQPQSIDDYYQNVRNAAVEFRDTGVLPDIEREIIGRLASAGAAEEAVAAIVFE